MQQLINKSKRLSELLAEYKEAKIYKDCLYHVVEQSDRKGWFFLVEIKTGQIKKDSTPANLKGWLKLRNIHPSKVYHYHLLVNIGKLVEIKEIN